MSELSIYPSVKLSANNGSAWHSAIRVFAVIYSSFFTCGGWLYSCLWLSLCYKWGVSLRGVQADEAGSSTGSTQSRCPFPMPFLVSHHSPPSIPPGCFINFSLKK